MKVTSTDAVTAAAAAVPGPNRMTVRYSSRRSSKKLPAVLPAVVYTIIISLLLLSDAASALPKKSKSKTPPPPPPKKKTSRKTSKNAKHSRAPNPPPTPSPTPPLIDVGGNGCKVDEFKVFIQNNLEVTLYAMYGTPSEGNLQPDGCNGSSGHVDYNSCWSVQPGETNYMSATTSSACKGVEGTFTYGPSAAYTKQTGLKSIALSYKDEGGKHGSLKHDQQFNYDDPDKGYTFGQQYATDMSKCQDQNHLKCEITMTVETTKSPPTPIPPSVIAYKGSWQSIASNGNVAMSSGTSWSNSQSSTYETSFTDGFTEGAGSTFGGASVSVGASQTWSTTSSNTISETNSGSYGISCSSQSCAGRLYQWQMLGEYTSNDSQIVKSCFFTCVPNSTPNGPLCPYPYCETGGCQCCNAVWMQDNNSTTDNHLAPSAGGNCKEGCGGKGVACTYDDECCAGTCNSGGFFPGGNCS